MAPRGRRPTSCAPSSTCAHGSIAARGGPRWEKTEAGEPMSERGAAHIFDRLGVRTVLNAHEVMRSAIGGTHVRPEALEAMAQAAERFVYLPELLEEVGRRLA